MVTGSLQESYPSDLKKHTHGSAGSQQIFPLKIAENCGSSAVFQGSNLPILGAVFRVSTTSERPWRGNRC